MMINAGGGGFKMVRPVYGIFNPFHNYAQRPSRYGSDPPQWDAAGIEAFELNAIAQREARGTALGDTMLRSVSNPNLRGVRPLT